jgi:hypothetical protein
LATPHALTGSTTLREWEPGGRLPAGFTVQAVVIGRDEGQLALEVVLLDAGVRASMSREALGAFHASRLGKRITPVVVAARRDGQTWLFGPNAQASVVGPFATDQAQRSHSEQTSVSNATRLGCASDSASPAACSPTRRS